MLQREGRHSQDPMTIARSWAEPTSHPRDNVLSRLQRSQQQHRRRGFTPLPRDPPPTSPGALWASSPGQRLPGHALSSLPSPHAPAPSTSHGRRVSGSPSLVFLRGVLHKAQPGGSGQVPQRRCGLWGSLPTSGGERVLPDNRPDATFSNSFIENKRDLFQFTQRVSLS